MKQAHGMRWSDGSAGDANYAVIGEEYARYRQPEPAIVAAIESALGDAAAILNVGAGAGSYEPMDRAVVAVEPSASMRAQRPPSLARAIDGVAEKLPFRDGQFDASMATFSIHQWKHLKAGLNEMRRVTRGPVVILTCDPDEVQRFWLNDYAPLVLATEARRYPPLSAVAEFLAGETTIDTVPIPLHCKDGFNEAYYGRPERLLEAGARLSCSAWSFVDDLTASAYVEHLRQEIETGAWDLKYGHWRSRSEFHGSLRLIVSRPCPAGQ